MIITYGNAIREALDNSLHDDETAVLFGQDIQHNLYGYTGELLDKYGSKRIKNTPISEAAIVGTAIGSAMCGLKPIIDLTVANFLYIAMDQIVNMASKSAYMYNGQFKLPLTIMCSTLYNTSSAAQHSDRPHPMLMNTPGLKVVTPSSPQDAYSLLRASIVDQNPVIYFSDRSLFHNKEDIDIDLKIDLGKASILSIGNEITIVTIAGCTKMAMDLLPKFKENKISVEIIDVRSLVPLDMQTIKKSVLKTGKIVIADTANKTCSAASEISSRLAEDVFNKLKAPIGIVAYDDVPVPFGTKLESKIMPTKEKIFEKVINTLKYIQ